MGAGPQLWAAEKPIGPRLVAPSRSLWTGPHARDHQVQHHHHHQRGRISVEILGGGGQIQIRCVHAMVWHAPGPHLNLCKAVYT